MSLQEGRYFNDTRKNVGDRNFTELTQIELLVFTANLKNKFDILEVYGRNLLKLWQIC